MSETWKNGGSRVTVGYVMRTVSLNAKEFSELQRRYPEMNFSGFVRAAIRKELEKKDQTNAIP